MNNKILNLLIIVHYIVFCDFKYTDNTCIIMKKLLQISLFSIPLWVILSCSQAKDEQVIDIIFLHHSTGAVIWKGKTNTWFSKTTGKISDRVASLLQKKAQLPLLFEKYNHKSEKNYSIRERTFPKITPYGWNNFPYDYYNIWVKNAGPEPYLQEPTLEMLSQEYEIIIFKHCFPVSNIQPDNDSADIDSNKKTLDNYILQYLALRQKLNSFPKTKFILFTGAAQVKALTTEEEALKAREFFRWVIDEWDKPDDNIYLWDLYSLQTEGDLFFKDEYARSSTDPHPNVNFANEVGKLLFNRIIDVIENNGTRTRLTGETL